MKICENGIIRDMTPEEIAEMERLASEMPEPEPSLDEQIAELRASNAELREALELLLSGETGVKS